MIEKSIYVKRVQCYFDHLLKMLESIRAALKYPKTNIYETIYLFVIFYKILNLFNFNFDGQAAGDQNVPTETGTPKAVSFCDRLKSFARFDNIYFFSQLSLMIGIFYSVVKDGNFFHTQISIIAYGNYFFTVIATLFLLMICITSYINQKNYVVIFRMFYEFDCRLEALNFTVDHNYEFLFVVKHFIFHIVFLAILTVFMWYRNTLTYLEFFLRTLPFYSYIAVLGIFHGFLCFFEQRFRILNNCFEFYFITPMAHIGPAVDKYKIYYEINSLYEHLNSTFDRYLTNMNFQIMFAIGDYVIYTGFTAFTTYLILAHYSDALSSELFNLFFDIDFTVLLITTISRSDAMTTRAKELADLIHAASNIETNNGVLQHLDFFCFSNQISYRYPVATCGLFDFDWPLVFSVFASLCMYLIILIQFDNPNVLKNK